MSTLKDNSHQDFYSRIETFN